MTAATTEPAPARTNGRVAAGLPDASLRESVEVLLTGLVPTLVRGLFSPRPRAQRWLTAIDADGRAVRVLSGVRRRHGGQGVRLLKGRMVVVWGADALQELLDDSATRFASDGGAKAKGMSHFQPEALTLSRGEEWRDRRAFADAVLRPDERLHPLAGHFLEIVADEAARLPRGELRWEHWEQLWDRITLRVVLGDRARDDQALTRHLETLMGEANRLVGLSRGDDYYELYGALERYLVEPEQDSLLALVPNAPQTDRTRVVHQIPHWLFAMRDTLGASSLRGLAAAVADPAIERRVRAELEGADLTDPAAVDRLEVLEGVFQEAMRLWPATPLVAREAMQDTTLVGCPVAEGTQLMVINPFNHRDADHVADADRVVPERWAGGARDYRFNHLSNGSQWCPGGPLVLLLGKAVLAQVLAGRRVRLEQPRLDPGAPLPHMLDHFRLAFSAS
jgi:cytochrome P450